jgi:hypothetical protein
MKRNLFERLFGASPSRRELEQSYLEQSVSRHDLERRQREIEAGRYARF